MKASIQARSRRLYWAYCRVSTLKDEQAPSLAEQIAWAKGMAFEHKARLEIFSERASAKTVFGRPKCTEMLARLSAKAGQLPSILLVTSFDRLSRDMTDTLILTRALRERGVELFVRGRGMIKTDSFADQAAIVGQAMGGQAENDARSQRCKASWERRRREGKPTSNKAPYGLQLACERDVPAGDSAEWVRLAFQWYAEGTGTHTIALRFAASAPPHRVSTCRVGSNGLPIIRERQPVWEYNRICKMFAQRRYRGTLVPDDLFDRVQQLIASKPRWRQDARHEYPLSGAVKCASCGRSFHGHATGAKRIGQCGDKSKRVRYYSCIVCNYRINAVRMEAWFEESLDNLRAPKRYLKAWASEGRRSDLPRLVTERKKLERLIDHDLDIRRERAWELALKDDAVREDLPRALRTLQQEEALARGRLAEVLSEVEALHEGLRSVSKAQGLLESFSHLYAVSLYPEKRELASTLVAALGGVVASREGLVWRNDPRAKLGGDQA